MGNTSLVSLTLKFLCSSPSAVSLSSCFCVRKFSVYSSFSSVFLVNPRISHILIRESTFCRILGSAIKVSSNFVENQTFINQHQQISTVTNFTVLECAFRFCKSEENGGALLVSSVSPVYIQAVISASVFQNCSAQRGGAFFLKASMLALSLDCFLDCSSTTGSHAYLALTDLETLSYQKSVSITNCPSFSTRVPHSTTIQGGPQCIRNFNSSLNRFSGLGFWISIIRAPLTSISFSFLGNSNGISGAQLYRCDTLSISYSSVTNNTCFMQPFTITNEANSSTVVTLTKSFYSSNRLMWYYNANYCLGSLRVLLSMCAIDQDSLDIFGKSVEANYIGDRDMNEMTANSLYITRPAKCITQTIKEEVQEGHSKVILITVSAVASLLVIMISIMIILNKKRKVQISKWISEGGRQAMNEKLIGDDEGSADPKM